MINEETTDRASAPAAKSRCRFTAGGLTLLTFKQAAMWCGYLLLLLTPGTFVILPALCIMRRFVFTSR